MEPVIVVGLAVVAVVLIAPILAIVALARIQSLDRQIAGLRAELAGLDGRVARLSPPSAPLAARPAAPAARVAPPPTVAPARPPAAPPAPAPLTSEQPLPPVSPPPPASPPPSGDFAANLGPKILAAGAGLAFVVTLGLFVKLAWDNNWVGPTGRVLSGAVFGLGLLALGVRLLEREYRPLGQALAGAGLAGLYTSAFAAHAYYHLIPREASGALMVLITACAVVLAAALDTRV